MPRPILATIHVESLRHNLARVRQSVPDAKVWAVVKANGYGHGAVLAAQAALHGGATGLCVALVQEGLQLRAAGIDVPVMVLSEQPPADVADALAAGLILTVYSDSAIDAITGCVGGPHLVQLATLHKAWVFQLHDANCRTLVAGLLESHPAPKVGFGLGDDKRRIITKLGVEAREVIDLNAIFHQKGYRKDIGVKTAVAVVFNRRFLKSGKATTSNWAARQLSDSQLMYAANDAWAAVRVFDALG